MENGHFGDVCGVSGASEWMPLAGSMLAAGTCERFGSPVPRYGSGQSERIISRVCSTSSAPPSGPTGVLGGTAP